MALAATLTRPPTTPGFCTVASARATPVASTSTVLAVIAPVPLMYALIRVVFCATATFTLTLYFATSTPPAEGVRFACVRLVVSAFTVTARTSASQVREASSGTTRNASKPLCP